MGCSPVPTQGHRPPITEELGTGIPSRSTPRVCSCPGAHDGQGCAQGGCAALGARAGGTRCLGPRRLPPAACSARHGRWGFSGSTAGHTPGFAGEEELCYHQCSCGLAVGWLQGGHGAAMGSDGGAHTWEGGCGSGEPQPQGEGWRGCTCVWGGTGQPAAGEAALAVPGAVSVVSTAVGAGSGAPLGALPWAEAGFGWRRGEAWGSACSRPGPTAPVAFPRSDGALWTRGDCPVASSAQHGDTQSALPGSACTQRAQQLRVQHFSPGLHAVSLWQLIPHLAALALPARGQ